jgi:hypothetical protein
MGHKGVSVRKPKRSRPFSNADIKGASTPHVNAGQAVSSLIKDNRAFPNSGANPSAGINKKHQKGN